MGFWITALALALAIAALLGLAALGRRRAAQAAEAYDIEVYRDQLREVERDLARGVLGAEEAERIRLEVSRRLLDADRKAQAAAGGDAAPRRLTQAMAVAVAALVSGGSLALYAVLGAPGYPDMPRAARIEAADAARATRPAQAAAEAELAARLPQPAEINPEAAELMTRLRAKVSERPDDLQGQILLARSEAALGNFVAAYEAQERVLELKGEAATAEDWGIHADLLIMAAGGYVSPEAERSLSEVLRRDPEDGRARYLLGLLFAQTGRPDRTFEIWLPLLRQSPPDAPWLPPIREQLPRVSALAGEKLPPSLSAPAAGGPGPSAADMQAATEMSPEERQEMVRGMVGRLSERLATDGGPPEDWARLIGALGVLGEAEKARAIYAEAREVFGDAPAALATIESAAERADIAE